MPPPPTTAPSKPEREAENARIELAEIRTGADGRPAFALPFAAADIASVEVIDVDLIVVTHDGLRILIPEGALLAVTQADLKIAFSTGELSAGELFKRVGELSPVEGGSFRMQATTLKPQPPDPESGNDLDSGAGAEAQVQHLETQVAELQAQLDEAVRAAQPQKAVQEGEGEALRTPFTAFKTADPQPLDFLSPPARARTDEASAPATPPPGQNPNPSQPPLISNELPRPRLQASAEAKLSNIERWDGSQATPNDNFAAATLQQMLPDGRLKVRLTGGEAAQNWDTGSADSAKVRADLVFAPAGSLAKIQLSLADPAAALPPGFRIAGQDLRQGVLIDASDKTATRAALEWTVSADADVVAGTRFQIVFKYLDAQGKLIAASSLTLSHEDVRSAAALTESDANGLLIVKLPARGMSYDISGRDGQDDTIDAGNGDDILRGLGGNDVLRGGRGADILLAGEGADQLRGGTGADQLEGGKGNDSAYGEEGNDLLVGGEGSDVLDGGAGEDIASYAEAAGNAAGEGVTVHLATGDQHLNAGGEAAGDYLVRVEHLIGSAHRDLLVGDEGANLLRGGAGDDTLQGMAGADTLDGGSGSDTASYSRAGTAGLTVSLADATRNTGDAAGDLLLSIENVTGSAGNDTLEGDAGGNLLRGGAGGDRLLGADGDDVLEGDDGDDELEGGRGKDVLRGGAGDDTASYLDSDAAVFASLDSKDAALNNGEAQGDSFVLVENLRGTRHADTLVGDDGANRLEGEAGNDMLIGGRGGDALHGGEGSDTASYASATAAVRASLSTPSGNTEDALGDTYVSIENLIGSDFGDSLEGNSGANLLDGGKGNDTLTGHGGGDTYHGGTGSDTVDYGRASNAVAVYLQADRQGLSAGAAVGDRFDGVENITGSKHGDILVGDGLANELRGNAGNDLLDGGQGGGGDLLDGGADNDTATYADADASVSASLLSGGSAGDAAADSYVNIENLTGSAHDDALEGDSGDNIIAGGAGNDDLKGAGGSDVIYGGDGDDTLANIASLGALQTFYGGDGENDTGFDRVSYAGSENVLKVSLTAGGHIYDASGTTKIAAQRFIGIESLTGGEKGDELEGNERANTLLGDDGNDRLRGLDGNDLLQGESGDDELNGGQGADMLNGGTGTDTAIYLDADSGLTIDLTLTAADANSGRGTGIARGDAFDSIETVIASRYDDIIVAAQTATRVDGGEGIDTVDYAADTLGFTLDLQSGSVVPAAGSGSLIVGDSFVGVENVIGSASASNTITGNDAANALTGGEARDTLAGGRGDDRLDGGDDADELEGGADHDTLLGGAGNDLLSGGTGNDLLDGGTGAQDTASYAYAAGNVIVDLTLAGAQTVADQDRDTLSSIENLVGSNGNDVLRGSAQINRLEGGAGDDELAGRAGDDILLGGAGDDTLLGGQGADYLIGGLSQSDTTPSPGAGRNTASYADASRTTIDGDTSAGVIASLAAPGDNRGEYAAGDLYVNIQNLVGSAFNDRLTGDAQDNVLAGGDGNDTLSGGAGGDRLIGGAGNDSAIYAEQDNLIIDLVDGSGSGDARGDTFEGIEIIRATASSSGDIFIAGANAHEMQGGAGTDTVSYERAEASVSAALDALGSAGWASGDRYVDIENLTGSRYADSLRGDSGSNRIAGGAGDDRLYASRGGDDVLDGGQDSDTLSYEHFADAFELSITMNDDGSGTARVLTPGSGSLVQTDSFTGIENVALRDLSAQSAASGNGGRIDGNSSANQLTGGLGSDRLNGGGGADMLLGQAGNDTLDGGAEDDILDGGAGDDTLAGGAGNDRLAGGSGDDVLDGGSGDDRLYGAAGADRFSGGGATNAAYDPLRAAAAQAGDYAAYDTLDTALVVDFSNGNAGTGEAAGDRFDADITGVIGAQGATTFIGRDSAEVFIGNASNDTFKGSSGADIFDGGGGLNVADYSAETAALDVNLQSNVNTGGGAQGDRLYNIQTLLGGSGNDTLTGDASRATTLQGNAGNDSLLGGSGDDRLQGDAGDDRLDGGQGDDTLIAGSGSDVLGSSSGPNSGNDILDLLTGNADATLNGDQAYGGDGADRFILGQGQFNAGKTGLVVSGGAGNDTLELHAAQGGSGIDLRDFAGFGSIETLDLSRDNTASSVKITVAGLQGLVDDNSSNTLTLILKTGQDDFFIDASDPTSQFAHIGLNQVTFYDRAADAPGNQSVIAKLNIQFAP